MHINDNDNGNGNASDNESDYVTDDMRGLQVVCAEDGNSCIAIVVISFVDSFSKCNIESILLVCR